MLIIFTVTGQKVTHDLGKRTLVAGSVGEVQAAFSFDETWDDYTPVIVFTNTNQKCGDLKPIRYEGEPIDIPEAALKAGKLYVSVVGFAEHGKRRTTQKWDIQQAITVHECGAMGNCDLLRPVAIGSSGISEDDVAKDQEVQDMLDEVFDGVEPGKQDPPGPEGETEGPSEGEHEVAEDDEVQDVLDEVFGNGEPEAQA